MTKADSDSVFLLVFLLPWYFGTHPMREFARDHLERGTKKKLDFVGNLEGEY